MTDSIKHDCVAHINKMLLDKNTEIATAISFSDMSRELIQVATVKADVSKRGKAAAFFASYCPFCGVKLGKDSE